MEVIDTNAGLVTNFELLQHLQSNKRYPTYTQLHSLIQQYRDIQTDTHNDTAEYKKLHKQLKQRKTTTTTTTDVNIYPTYTDNINNILPKSIQSRLQLQYRINRLKQLQATCWLHDTVTEYLQLCPATTQTQQHITTTIHALQSFCTTHNIQLTLYEIQQCINLRVHNIVMLQLVIEDLYLRFNDDETLMQQFLDIIINNLPEAPVYTSSDTLTDTVDNDTIETNNDTEMNVENNTDRLQNIAQDDGVSSQAAPHRIAEVAAVSTSKPHTTTTHIPPTNGNT